MAAIIMLDRLSLQTHNREAGAATEIEALLLPTGYSCCR